MVWVVVSQPLKLRGQGVERRGAGRAAGQQTLQWLGQGDSEAFGLGQAAGDAIEHHQQVRAIGSRKNRKEQLRKPGQASQRPADVSNTGTANRSWSRIRPGAVSGKRA